MSSPKVTPEDAHFTRRTVEAAIRIGLLIMIAAWCFMIVTPFIIPVAWGMIIAVALHPFYSRMRAWLGGRGVLSAVLLTLLLLLTLIVPAILASTSLIDGVESVATRLRSGTLVVPPPESIGSWPLVGPRLQQYWTEVSNNLGAAIQQVVPHLKPVAVWLLKAFAGVGLAILQFVLSIIIAGVLLAYADGAGGLARALGRRLAGKQGEEFVDLAKVTVRGVTRGILGVAFIQASLIGLGFFVAGVPGAGLWAFACLLVGIIQLPLPLVQIPVIIYVFSVSSTGWAVVFLIWNVLIMPLDNVLKPILLGRGAQVPMAIIFLGAIGGFMAFGIIGLFVGAVVFSLAYRLFLAWLHEGDESPEHPSARSEVG